MINFLSTKIGSGYFERVKSTIVPSDIRFSSLICILNFFFFSTVILYPVLVKSKPPPQKKGGGLKLYLFLLIIK